MSILDIHNLIATSNNDHFFVSIIKFLLVTMLTSDIINVIVTSKKASLDIWNNIDIRNTFSDIKNYIFY